MLFIVTPVFNRAKFTKDYLNALKNQTNKEFKIIIVDDGSTDNTVKMIEEEFPETILLREEGDLWWAEATNVGIKYALKAGATHVMTLNDDTVPKIDFIENMQNSIKKKPKALLGALAVDAKSQKPIFGGELLNWKSCKYESLLDMVPITEQKGLHEVNVFPGRGLLIPAEVFQNIGFFDSKNFPQTVADLDFTIRATNAGYSIFCNYDARIKIYPEESGGVKLVQNRSWKSYYEHLFGMRGAANIRWFTIFTFKNAPKKYLVKFLVVGLFKRVLSYHVRWIKEIFYRN